MARASKFVGFVPVGLLAFTAALAVATVVGGWTADTRAVRRSATASPPTAWSPISCMPVSGYGIDEVAAR